MASTDWFSDARFGMFIHWGLYSGPGGIWKGTKIKHPYSEWLQASEHIPRSEYKALAKAFNPDKFNADEWVCEAKNAGMKYFVITAKHHDGFALWPTKASSYNIFDASPFKRDILGELATACRKHDIKLGFYYSHWQDWEGNGGDICSVHMENEEYVHPTEEEFERYWQNKCLVQVRELIESYDPWLLWFDTWSKDSFKLITPERQDELISLIRSLSEKCLVNSRIQFLAPSKDVDFMSTMDNAFPEKGFAKPWETSGPLNYSWAYHSMDYGWKETRELIQNLVKNVSLGGNYQLNVGPTGSGCFQEAAIRRLHEIGSWMIANEARGGEGGGGGYVTGGGSVLDCAFTSNRAVGGHAAGLHLSSGTELARCVFKENVAAKLGGGARAGSGFVYDCEFVGNQAGIDGGGGIRMDNATVTVSNCLFTGNVSAGLAGGVYHSNGFLTDCVVVSNISSRSGGQVVGGGVYMNAGVFQNSFIGYNAATNGSDGGAVAGAGGIVRNCLIIGNEARYGGAARYSGAFENCTIAGNKATSQGGGLWISSGKPTLTNCVLYANEAPAGANYQGAAVFTYTCTTPIVETLGNIQADPMFVTAGSGAGMDLVAGDYQLKRSSPCVDKALELPWMATARDYAGNERVFGGALDMVAYEYTPFQAGTVILMR